MQKVRNLFKRPGATSVGLRPPFVAPGFAYHERKEIILKRRALVKGWLTSTGIPGRFPPEHLADFTGIRTYSRYCLKKRSNSVLSLGIS